MRIAPQAWPFAAPLLIASIAAAIWLPIWLAVVGLLATLCVLAFFRDPHRTFEGAAEAFVCPADGVVTTVDTAVDEDVSPEPRRRVVIFLNVFNVHVQRAPCSGTVVLSKRRAGRKLAAYREDVDRVNESHLTVLQLADGDTVAIRQIAGLVARRVVPYLGAGDTVERGGLLGLIQFGSRVDVLLPDRYVPRVAVGQKVRAVATLLAEPLARDES
ncbi:MAG: phosphatidylserine decarboxylase [Acidobacteria bacterium]|nr:MAG: phosphatidylserine decarboxylase [Acidobacteriota bacterium]REK00094.1 MAG: phosphatidylserine decarboxylase [Acidobacteriota bacterium]